MFNEFFSHKQYGAIIGLSIASLAFTVPVQAETLHQAMSYAYKNSPQMMIEKQKLLLSDEAIISAKSGLYPSLNGELSFTRSQSQIFKSGAPNPPSTLIMGLTGTLSANYTLWDNGITQNRIIQAEIAKRAQKDMSLNAEQDFLMQTFTSYVDVLRDGALYNVQIKNFNVMSEQLKASEARFQVGEATSTDVALSQARKSGAVSAIANAKAQLDMSRAVYEQIIGRKPQNLRQPREFTNLLPKSLSAAIAHAESNHPMLQALKKSVLSAERAVKIAEAGLLPSANLFGSGSLQRAYDGSTGQASLTMGARLTVPIFNGGVLHSKTRQEKIRVAQERYNLSVSRAAVTAGVKARWQVLKAAKISARADESQIRASQAVLNGVNAEAKEGVRTNFDVLNSEKELLSAKVQAIISKRNILLSQIQLLSSIGSLTANKLGLNH